MQVMQMASSTDLKTAEVIRLTITPSVLDLADELTECHDGKSSGLILLTIESGSVRCSVLAPKRRLLSWRIGQLAGVKPTLPKHCRNSAVDPFRT